MSEVNKVQKLIRNVLMSREPEPGPIRGSEPATDVTNANRRKSILSAFSRIVLLYFRVVLIFFQDKQERFVITQFFVSHHFYFLRSFIYLLSQNAKISLQCTHQPFRTRMYGPSVRWGCASNWFLLWEILIRRDWF